MKPSRRLSKSSRMTNAFKAAFKVSNEKVAELEQESLKLHNQMDADPVAVTLIDGDGYLFSFDFIKQGKYGGQMAAVALSKAFTDVTDKRMRLHAIIYLNRNGLSELLYSNNIIQQKSDFDEFIVGFNQASPLLSIIDVGPGKEAADAKVREMLKLFAGFVQVQEIYFGGLHDGGYRSALASLQTEGLLKKVKILKGSSQVAYEISTMDVPFVTFEGVFSNEKLAMQYNGSNQQRGNTKLADRLLPVVDSPSKPSKKRPCIMFYLLDEKCPFGDKCWNSHKMILSEEDLASLRQEAKKQLCRVERKQGRCLDADCIYGHKLYGLIFRSVFNS
ncbi:hypothetical protein DL93DRAFT_7123 [Clavulina sp. PMI_390]|nr:hypothetical protein DL93DRAFT_7123 [Clavulina sp. PMI_390]